MVYTHTNKHPACSLSWKLERDTVILLEKKHDLPFRPNLSLVFVKMLIKIKNLKKKRDKYEDGDNGGYDSYDKQ